ncbi:hypothetical protein [Sulfuricurvum sp.]|uniref:hypothetical protein n=1 Tax=Sulfuricurvum sp. TaxID=2025608 RepID=UPI003BB7AAB4
MADTWYEEVIRGLCIALLAGGTVRLLADKDFTFWAFTPMLLGIFGLIILAKVRKKV